MASRILGPARRVLKPASFPSAILRPTPARTSLTSPISRSFQSSSIRLAEGGTPQPVKRPVGAFRGGLFGFFVGSVGSGVAVYYYILEEYRVSNQLLTEDIFTLQAAVQRIEAYVRTVDEQIQKKN